MEDRDRETLISCGTQCCLVGWAALAFGERGCRPRLIENPATAKFLEKFCELAGKPYKGNTEESNYIGQICCHASDVFEGDITGEELTPSQALEYWEKTAEYFGYNINSSKRIK